jgi:hypothetical protein
VKNRGPWIIAGGVVTAALIVAGALFAFHGSASSASASTPAPRPSTGPRYGLTGTLTRNFDSGYYPATQSYVSADELAQQQGCPDLEQAPVRISSPSGKVLAHGKTSAAQVQGSRCSVSFALEIPEARLYSFEIAGCNCGTYNFERLQADSFNEDLELARRATPEQYGGPPGE